MVSQEVILETIENIASSKLSNGFDLKCSRNKIKGTGIGIGFNKEVRKALDDFRTETCGDTPFKTEKLCVINNNGEVVYTKNGTSNQVKDNEDKIYKLREKYGMLHATHNHPSTENDTLPYGIIPTMLSEADAKQLLRVRAFDDGRFTPLKFDYFYKSITAESPNGSRVTLMKNNDFNPSNEEDYMIAYNHLNTLWNDYSQKFITTKGQFVAYYRSEGSDGWFSEKYGLKGKSEKECIEIIDNAVQKEIGSFEDELIPIRQEFNKCNIELSVEWK